MEKWQNDMVTVLLPTYNSEKYIAQCIKSILNQTFTNFELLIVDSESTDNTVRIIEMFNDSRINLHQIKRCPLNISLNYGLRIASFDLIARMDSDDLMRSDRLKIQIQRKLDNPDLDIITCNFAFFDKNGIFCVFRSPEEDGLIKERLLLHNVINNPGILFDRRTILKHGGYNDSLVEDYELWLRLLKEVKYYCLPDVLIYMRYRINSRSRKSLVKTKEAVYLLQQKYFKKEYNSMIGKNNVLLGWREFFYGDKKLARVFWKREFNSPSLILGYFITFLPENLFEKIKEFRVILRLKYIIYYFSAENKIIRAEFKRLIN